MAAGSTSKAHVLKSFFVPATSKSSQILEKKFPKRTSGTSKSSLVICNDGYVAVKCNVRADKIANGKQN